MWTRIEFAVRRAIARALPLVGTPPVSLALAALVALYALAAAIWARVGSEEVADALSTSWPYWALCAAAAVDGVVVTTRAARAAFPERFRPGAAALAPRDRVLAVGRLLLAAAWLLAAAGLLASLAARDRFTLWAADGETFEGAPGQYLTRAAPRTASPGPRPLAFEVERVEPRLAPDGTMRTVSVGILLDGRRRLTSPWRPVWLGGTRLLWASGYAYAPRYELVGPGGSVLEGAFVKLALLPRGTSDHLRLERLPHRVYFQLAGGVPLRGGAAGLRDVAFQVEVFRGKLPVAEGVVAPSGELRFEGLTLRIPEVRYVAKFTLLDDPGVFVLGAALAAALAGVGLLLSDRKERRAILERVRRARR